MKTITATSLRGVLGTGSPWLGALALAVAVAGCTSLLDVKNPNNVNEGDLSNPASASSQANGVLSSLARAWGNILTPYAVATDELTWIGSRDAWQTLDQGTLTEPTNEFVDAAFFYVGEARWFADATITRLTGFAAAGTLADTSNLENSYLYGALIYTTIGDFFDNFPIGSDKTAAAPPVGPANMDQVYDAAIAYATSGITLAQKTGHKSLELALTAARARAEHAKAVWALFPHPATPTGPPANPLVSNAAATADAKAALTLAASLTQPDWRYRFSYSQPTVTTDIGFEVNERLEMRIGPVYAGPACAVSGCATGGKVAVKATDIPAGINLKDPIDNRPDSYLSAVLSEFLGNTRYGPLTMLSAREMHLIVAEAALDASDIPGFTTAINTLRALSSGLTAYDPSNPAHPTPINMLHYEREVNLYLQGRRLADEYRFGAPADLWLPGKEATTTPVFLPITISERLANQYCVSDPASCN